MLYLYPIVSIHHLSKAALVQSELRIFTVNIGSHHTPIYATTLQQLHTSHQRRIQFWLDMPLTSIASTDRHVTTPIRVHDKDGSASHLLANAQANPLVGRWS